MVKRLDRLGIDLHVYYADESGNGKTSNKLALHETPGDLFDAGSSRVHFWGQYFIKSLGNANVEEYYSTQNHNCIFRNFQIS